MTRWGAFALGGVVGMCLLQIGHALYLRSGDYMLAFMATAVCGSVLVGIGNSFDD